MTTHRYSTRLTDWQRQRDAHDALPPDSDRTFTAIDLDAYRRSLATSKAPGMSLVDQDRERIGSMRLAALVTVMATIGTGIVVWAVVEAFRHVMGGW